METELVEVFCKTIILSEKEVLEQFIRNSFRNNQFDFNKIVETPENIKKYKKTNNKNLSEEWFFENWGTLSNASSTVQGYEIITKTKKGEYVAVVEYTVDNYSCEKVIKSLSKKFPDSMISHYELHMHENFAKSFFFKNGVLLQKDEKENWEYLAKNVFDLKFLADGEG